MNRILRILFLAIVFFMGYLWFGQLFKSCNSPKSDIGVYSNEDVAVDEADQLPNHAVFSDEDSVDKMPVSEDESKDPIDYDKLDNLIDTKGKPQPEAVKEEIIKVEPALPPVKENTPKEQKPVTAPVKKDNTSSSTYVNDANEPFLVIAGSYLVEENASEMITTLKKMGYSGAEKIVFDLSKFYSVCVGRYKDHEAASETVKKLKSSGIESYVHRRK